MLIMSFTAAESWLKHRPPYYDVISLGPEAPSGTLCRRQLVLDFDDICSRPDLGDGRHPDDRVPQTKHVCQAVLFARKSEDERLLIHCQAGVSRSPAIAWCILLDRYRDPRRATVNLFELHPLAIPNPVLVYYGLEVILGATKEYDAVRGHMFSLSLNPRKRLIL